jgi:hypothetical protein
MEPSLDGLDSELVLSAGGRDAKLLSESGRVAVELLVGSIVGIKPFDGASVKLPNGLCARSRDGGRDNRLPNGDIDMDSLGVLGIGPREGALAVKSPRYCPLAAPCASVVVALGAVTELTGLSRGTPPSSYGNASLGVHVARIASGCD